MKPDKRADWTNSVLFLERRRLLEVQRVTGDVLCIAGSV